MSMPNRGQPGQGAASESPIAKLLGGQASNKTLLIVFAAAALLLMFCIVVPLLFLIGSVGSGSGHASNSTNPFEKGGPSPTNSTPLRKLPPGASNRPQTVIQGALADMQKNFLEDAYDRFSPEYKRNWTSAQWRDYVEKFHRGLIGFRTYELKPLVQDGSVAQFRGKTSGGPNGSAVFTVEVTRENDGWRINKFVAE